MNDACDLTKFNLFALQLPPHPPESAALSNFGNDARPTMAHDDTDFVKQERGLNARAAKMRKTAKASGNKLGVMCEVVDFYSDGTRLSGTIWRPEAAFAKGAAKLPGILLAHGWGAKRAHLDFSYALRFAQAGFVTMTFDYRGWGDSDGVLVSVGRQPRTKDNKTAEATLPVRIVRKVVDPAWQRRDLASAMDYFCGVAGLDTSRIGLWGSSFGSGYVLMQVCLVGVVVGALPCVEVS